MQFAQFAAENVDAHSLDKRHFANFPVGAAHKNQADFVTVLEEKSLRVVIQQRQERRKFLRQLVEAATKIFQLHRVGVDVKFFHLCG